MTVYTDPYPIVGTTQLGAGITIIGNNISAQESTLEQVTTASDNSFIIDPANMGSYSDGDIIKITIGNWHRDVKVDIINYPMGKIVTVNKPPFITTFKTNGLSKNNGIPCGKSKIKSKY